VRCDGSICRNYVFSATFKSGIVYGIGGTVKGKRRIGFFIFDGITALDLVGPMEAFAAAVDSTGTPQYELVTVAKAKRDVRAENGLVIRPREVLANVGRLDTIVIPGGRGLREHSTCKAIADWLTVNSKRVRRVVSICTGIYGVANSGLLDGREVTTHWRFAQDVQARFPKLRVNAASIFLVDGKFYTSAGITSGIDLSLALIEEDCGRSIALSVARELIVFLKRPGGQEQYSEPLRFQIAATDKTADLAAWIDSNLEKDLSVRALAERACLSGRQFARHFKAVYRMTPGAYVERARLEQARRHLSETNHGIDNIARTIGYSSDDAFRRSFQKHFRVSPKAYRNTFGKEGRYAQV
jgi:transcriptional regulator GlxA family with amidase domain